MGEEKRGKEKYGKETGKGKRRLRPVPLTAGIYSFFLGFGLLLAGIAGQGMGETGGIGALRCLGGLVIACLGLYGIWDGIRDLVRKEVRPAWTQDCQYIFTDVNGKRSSHVSSELLQKQLDILAGKGEDGGFSLQILPPVFVQGQGHLVQISYLYGELPRLAAFFRQESGGYGILQRSADVFLAGQLLEQFLTGVLDFSLWEEGTVTVHPGREKGYAGQYLRIFGESWRDEHKFFSARDLELAAEGLACGKYTGVELGLGAASFRILPAQEEKEALTIQLYIRGKGGLSVFMREGTVTQVKFWLVQIFREGLPEALDGWQDITGGKKG